MLQQLEALLGLSGIYSIDFAPGATREDVKNIRRAYVVWSLRSAITRRILGAPDDAPILPKCRLLALYLSTQSPLAYIEEVNIDPTGHTCIFKDRHHFEKRYSKIGGSWSEVDGNGQFRETLETQLQRIQPQVPPTS
ncbi:uncharacterized protein LOC126837592 [Adelges cooleyi]|uniref:uncharacterized protein LOC126837592 n=1 Tax=Adelges cooleyi TaxID=133065 RepID=UPI00217F9F59|nr:uncharacterized protein LOC126837592 [Adelges cooleyi]